MTVQLYEGCWGVTRGGEKRGPMVPNQDAKDPWPFKIVSHSGAFVCAYSKDGIACSHVYPRDLEPHNDIIAVFAAEPEADAYLAGGKPDPRQEGGTIPPAAPKPVTWPVGVTEMVHQGTSICVSGRIEISNADGQYNADAARQLSDLLRAAADYVEGRG